MHLKADDPAGILIHDHHYPVSLQQNRFALEEVTAPQLVGLIALAFASQGQAFILDFQKLADEKHGESAWQPFTDVFSEAGFEGTVTVSANGGGYAYLDARIGSARAGMGVCPKLLAGAATGARPGMSSNICDPSDDDNIRSGEELTFEFDVTAVPPGQVLASIVVSRLWISGTHDGDGSVAGDTVLIRGASQALAGNGWATGTAAEVANFIQGPSLTPAEAMTVGYGGDSSEQFYVSAMEVFINGRRDFCDPIIQDCSVPIVGVIPLLGIGLLGMMLINRRTLYS